MKGQRKSAHPKVQVELATIISAADKLVRNGTLEKLLDEFARRSPEEPLDPPQDRFFRMLPGSVEAKVAVMYKILDQEPGLPDSLAVLRPLLHSKSYEKTKRLRDQVLNQPTKQFMQSPMWQSITKELKMAGEVRAAGPRGGERKLETKKRLAQRNADIRKQNAHYELTGAKDRIELLKKHFPKKDGKLLSTKQIKRILK